MIVGGVRLWYNVNAHYRVAHHLWLICARRVSVVAVVRSWRSNDPAVHRRVCVYMYRTI